jgi:Domain of unknown function (DUF4340)
MKFRTTFILLIVLAALGGYVLWSGRQKSDASATTGAAAIPVLQLDPAGILAVEVRGEGKQVRVERDASGWQVKVPKPGPADAFRVTEVISGLAKLNATQTITPTGQDLAPYGLDKPAYEVRLEGSTPETLRLGAKNPDGSATYVQRAAAPAIYLAKDSLIDTIERWVSDPPAQPTPAPTAPPLTVLPTVPITPTSVISPTTAPAPPGPPLKANTPTLLPTATNPLSLTVPLVPTATP